jgi:hypothetical protein
LPLMMTLGLGVIGGAALGKAAVDHAFVHGISDAERSKLIGVCVGTAVVFGAAYALDIDYEWLTVDGLATKAEKWINK